VSEMSDLLERLREQQATIFRLEAIIDRQQAGRGRGGCYG